jgi:hypothetical protein
MRHGVPLLWRLIALTPHLRAKGADRFAGLAIFLWTGFVLQCGTATHW